MIPKKTLLLTLLSCAIAFGYTYCLDLPQTLQVPLRQQPYNFTTSEFNLLYFFTFAPIFLFNIPIGVAVDRCSITKSLYLLLLLSLVSMVISTVMICTTVSGYLGVMYAMRCVFGCAGEGIFVVQSKIVNQYSRRKDFEFVMAAALAFPFLFDSVNSVVTTNLYDTWGSMLMVWGIGCGVTLLSFVCGFVLVKLFIKKKMEYQLEESQKSSENQQQKESQEQQKFSMHQMKSFSKKFWFIIAAIFFIQISLCTYLDNMNDLIVKRFNISYSNAGNLLIIPYTCVALFGLLFGILMDRWPVIRRPVFVLSTFFHFLGVGALYFLPNTDEPTELHYIFISFFCIAMGLTFSIYNTAVLTSLPNFIPKNTIGTAYGVVGSLVGLSQCIMPVINSAIISSDGDLAVSYRNLSLLYILLSFIGFCFAVYIWFGDYDEMDVKIEEIEFEQQKLLSTESQVTDKI